MKKNVFRNLTVVCVLFLGALGSLLAQNRYNLPHIATGRFSGGSIRTTFVVFNNNPTAATVALQLRDNPGQPLSVAIAGLGAGSQFGFELQPGEARFLQTDDSAAVTEGSAVINSTGPIGVSAIFTILDQNGAFLTETGIAASEGFLSDGAFAVDVTGQFNTGVALQNLAANAPVDVTFELFDEAGVSRGMASRQLAAQGHLGVFVGGPGGLFNVTNFRGKVRMTSTSPVAALTLRQNSVPLSFTTLPVVANDSPQTEFLLPQIANGGNVIQTTFVLFNLGGQAATADVFLTDDDGQPYSVRLRNGAQGSQFTFQIPANGAVFAQTNGAGPVKAGAARIVSDRPIGAAGIFTILNAQGNFATETGIGDSPQLNSFSLPVDMTGSFDTGVAFFNNGLTAVELLLTFYPLSTGPQGQVEPETATLAVEAKFHRAQFVSEFFARGRRGMLSVRAGSPTSALTLRQNSSPLSFTTLPVAEGTPDPGSEVPSLALLAKARTAVNLTSDRVVDEVLDEGLTISGRATTPGPLDFVTEVSAVAADGTVFAGVFDFESNEYLIVVPRGAYTLRFCHVSLDLTGFPAGLSSGSTFVHNQVPNVSVQANVKRDVNLSAATLRPVSGRVANLSVLPPELTDLSVFLTLTSANARTSAVGELEADGSFSASVENGTYIASLIFSPADDEQSLLGVLHGAVEAGPTALLYNIGQFTVNGPLSGVNLSIPALVRLSGRVSQPQSPALPRDTAVTAFDATAPERVLRGCLVEAGFSIGPAAPTGPYRTILVRNRNYDVQAGMPVTSLGTPEEGTLTIPGIGRNIRQFAADSTLDFNFPMFPVQRRLSGRVTDGGGNPRADVAVVVTSDALTGTPNAVFSASTLTDGDGRYSLQVLSGTNYRIDFVPPLPDVLPASAQ